jgi:hypothetical protein
LLDMDFLVKAIINLTQTSHEVRCASYLPNDAKDDRFSWMH